MPQPLDYRPPEPRPPIPPGVVGIVQYVVGVVGGMGGLWLSLYAHPFVLAVLGLILLGSLVCLLSPGLRPLGAGLLSSIGFSVLAVAAVCGWFR